MKASPLQVSPGPVMDFRWILFKTRLACAEWGMQGSWTRSPVENSLYGGWCTDGPVSGLTTSDNSMALGSWQNPLLAPARTLSEGGKPSRGSPVVITTEQTKMI